MTNDRRGRDEGLLAVTPDAGVTVLTDRVTSALVGPADTPWRHVEMHHVGG